MQPRGESAARRTMFLLHLAIVLTGLLHAVGGPLLPSLASALHLNDSQSGLLFLLYFAGNSAGALLCVGRYARLVALGFAGAVVCCLAVSRSYWPTCLVAFWFLGVSVGLSMSALNLYVGREYPRRAGSVLALLNCTWGVGALSASIFAARVLVHHNYRTAYLLLAAASAFVAIACWMFLRDDAQTASPSDGVRTLSSNWRRIAVLVSAAFLEVGVENLSLAWLSTYASRTAGRDAVFGASLSAGYWLGFLGSRALTSLVLLRATPAHVLRVVIPMALCAAIVLVVSPTLWTGGVAMVLLGIALGPVYPLIVAQSFADLHRTADARWVLGAAGFGGSVLPWLTGWLSGRFGGVRAGLVILPAALLLMLFLTAMKFRKTTPTSVAQ
jgi:FHS family glucose/mannose:H+ symporter-like MFS transporter